MRKGKYLGQSYTIEILKSYQMWDVFFVLAKLIEGKRSGATLTGVKQSQDGKDAHRWHDFRREIVSVCVCCFYGVKRRFSASLLTQKRSVFSSCLFQLASFTPTNGVSRLLSLTQREKISRPFPFPYQTSVCRFNPYRQAV